MSKSTSTKKVTTIKQAVAAAGFPEDYLDKSQTFVSELNRAYEAIPALASSEAPKLAEAQAHTVESE